MAVKFQTEQHLELLSVDKDAAQAPESIHVKMPHYWKSHVAAHIIAKSFNA